MEGLGTLGRLSLEGLLQINNVQINYLLNIKMYILFCQINEEARISYRSQVEKGKRVGGSHKTSG